MKIKIGTLTVSFSEEAIKKSNKQSYVDKTVKALMWTGIDEKILAEKIGEVFDTVTKANL